MEKKGWTKKKGIFFEFLLLVQFEKVLLLIKKGPPNGGGMNIHAITITFPYCKRKHISATTLENS